MRHRPSPQLCGLTLDEVEEVMASLGEARYRARQVLRWLYSGRAASFAEMTDLPQGLRLRLAERLEMGLLKPLVDRRADGGLTRKLLLGLADGRSVEAVLMSYPAGARTAARNTLCLSTQAGCALGCVFCATGQQGLDRNLTAAEIVAQALHFQRLLVTGDLPAAVPRRVTNVVFMGMGEPLANYIEVMQAVRLLHSASGGLGLGARQFTLSTVGLVPGIRRLAGEELPVSLAVSLHAPNDELRDRLLPINRRYPLAALLEACRDYIQRTGRRLSFEYVLLEGINDSLACSRQLASLVRGLHAHVNLIPANPTADPRYMPPSPEHCRAFRRELQRLGLNATIRAERGLDIDGGCGQLRSDRERAAPAGVPSAAGQTGNVVIPGYDCRGDRPVAPTPVDLLQAGDSS